MKLAASLVTARTRAFLARERVLHGKLFDQRLQAPAPDPVADLVPDR